MIVGRCLDRLPKEISIRKFILATGQESYLRILDLPVVHELQARYDGVFLWRVFAPLQCRQTTRIVTVFQRCASDGPFSTVAESDRPRECVNDRI
jgi:hypothetical protein